MPTLAPSPAAPAQGLLRRALREPLVHFLALGAVFFALNAWRETRRPAAASAARIEVTGQVIERLRAAYERQFGKAPDEEAMRAQVTMHIREEVLCREALALGLDRDDTIVRRRLAQKMEFLTGDLASAAEPNETAVRAFFDQHAAKYAKAGRVSFRHVYFSKEKHGAGTQDSAGEALAALVKGSSEETLGDPFLPGFDFVEREPNDVIATFGTEFAQQLAALPAGAWNGPVSSTYGLHLVRIEGREEPRLIKLEEVRETVMRDFRDEQRTAANRAVYERLRERYQVAVDEAAMVKAVAPSNKTALR